MVDDDGAYDGNYYGVWYGKSKRLGVDPRQADTELPQTVLHELLHAIGTAYEIEDLQRHRIDQDTGRVLDKTDLLTGALLRLLRDNPELVDWLVNTR